MIVLKAFRYRLYPTPEQESLFRRTTGCRRALWNAALEQRSMWRPGRRSIGYHDQAGELRALKVEFPWFKETPSQCLQQVLIDLDKAFRRFFEGLGHYPKRKRKWSGDSFRFPDPKQFAIGTDGIKLPKAGYVKAVIHRELLGKPKSITISRHADHWYASVQCEVEMTDPMAPNGPAIGIDLGIAQPVTLSSGLVLDIGRSTEQERRLLSRRQRAAARKRRGSMNRRKALARVARLKARLVRRRLDSLHKATRYLAKSHRLIAIEDLNVKGMTASAAGSIDEPGRSVRAKSGLNRSILEMAFSTFRSQLDYKTKWYGSTLVVVPARNTSLTCHACGHVAPENRENQATFSCVSCGHEANADVNAARNILARAIAGKAATPKLRQKLRTSVKPRTAKLDQIETPGEHGCQPAEPSVRDTATKQEFRSPQTVKAA